jgi:mRNA interferase MazF
MIQQKSFHRGEIWMVDFGQPIGHEQGLKRPAVIISKQELADTAHIHGLLIVVPGTSTEQINPKTKQTRISCIRVDPSASNGLSNTTYFMSEKLRSTSISRLGRRIGCLANKDVKALEQCLCLVMDLFA